MTDDIVAFIRARLDEDARMAAAAIIRLHRVYPGSEEAGSWKSGDIYLSDDGSPTGHDVWADDDSDSTVMSLGVGDSPVAAHIARHDPARVLRGVEAKRRQLDALWFAGSVSEVYDEQGVLIAGAGDAINGVLRAIASEWSTHPEYRQEWQA